MSSLSQTWIFGFQLRFDASIKLNKVIVKERQVMDH